MKALMSLCILLLYASACYSACTTEALTQEFQANPANVVCIAGTTTGYTPHITAGNDTAVMECLNRIRTAPETGYNVFRLPIPTFEFANAYAEAEFLALTPEKLNQLTAITSGGFVDPQAANVQGIIKQIFPQATAPITRANLTAIAKTPGSRAMVLCNNGVTGYSVSLDQVSAALTPLRPTN